MTYYKELRLWAWWGATAHNNVCCRLRSPAATSDPTGHKQGEEQNSVAWLRKVQYFSTSVCGRFDNSRNVMRQR